MEYHWLFININMYRLNRKRKVMNIPSENTTDIIVYGMNMANQMQLPQSNIEDEIKLSIQIFFGIGSNIYGFKWY